MPQSYKTMVDELRFTKPALDANGWVGIATPTLTSDGRASLGAGDAVHQGDRGTLIDNLLSSQFQAKLTGFTSGSDIAYIGMTSAASATPASVAEACWFKIVGAAAGPRVFLESKDGTTTVADEDTGINLREDTWNRFMLDFEMGIQTISPPGKSRGGKGAIQYSVTNDRGWSQSPLLTKFLDMWAYADFLQAFVLNVAGSGGTILLEGCDIAYKRFGSQE